MAQGRVFTLLGDSNVRRYINKTSVRASQDIKAAQILSCGRLEIFKESLEKTRAETDICIISCLTVFLANADGSEVVAQRIDPVLQDIREVLDEVCASRAGVQFLLSSWQLMPRRAIFVRTLVTWTHSC